MDELRNLRLRHSGLLDGFGRTIGDPPVTTPRRLVQIVTVSATPSASPNIFWAARPVLLAGTEVEGGTDSAGSEGEVLYVDVINRPPVVGDVLVAHAVGGRWVAELTMSTPTPTGDYHCGTCDIPKHDLSYTLTNSIFGDTSGTLTYSSVGPKWSGPCTQLPDGLPGHGAEVNLLCNNAFSTLLVQVCDLVCPNSDVTCCTNLAAPPDSRLTITSLTCGDSFMLTADFEFSQCFILFEQGYGTLTITA
jgi:hypothetical protein